MTNHDGDDRRASPQARIDNFAVAARTRIKPGTPGRSNGKPLPRIAVWPWDKLCGIGAQRASPVPVVTG